MKTTLITLILFLTITGTAQSFIQYGEAELKNPDLEVNAYVDYMVTDFAPDISEMDVVFGKGDRTSFTESSRYYYFYQLEATNITQLKFLYIEHSCPAPVSPETEPFTSAGYIKNKDLDYIPFNHNIVDEHEQAFYLRNPLADIDISSGWVWEYSGLELQPNEESAVLFFTSKYAPAYSTASVFTKDSTELTGTVPAPAVPEPSAMLLFSLSGVWFGLKKIIKK